MNENQQNLMFVSKKEQFIDEKSAILLYVLLNYHAIKCAHLHCFNIRVKLVGQH